MPFSKQPLEKIEEKMEFSESETEGRPPELENIGKASQQGSPKRDEAQSLPPHLTARRSPQSHGSEGISLWNVCVQSVYNILPTPYCETWLKCLTVLHFEGPVPESWRIYIAIMALCRHEVAWAVRALNEEFKAARGDLKWLSGVKFVPKKLKSLSTVNNILAHRPWLLTSEHINILTKTEPEESWSISELCHALCLLAHFHSFASLLHACLPHQPEAPPPPLSGSEFNSPRSSPARNVLTPTSHRDKFPSEEAPVADSRAAEREGKGSRCISFSTSDDSPAIDTQTKTYIHPRASSSSSTSATSVLATGSGTNLPGAKSQQLPCETKVGGTGAVGGAKREIQASSQPNKQSKNESHSLRSAVRREEAPSYYLREYQHLCQDREYLYEEPFDVPEFKTVDFNWQDHAFCALRSRCPEMAAGIEERFVATKGVSHPSWGEDQENGTYLYRRVVRAYIQALYGIQDDTIQYQTISSYLSQEVQEFIKTCCCWPERLEGKIPLELLQSADDVPSQLVPLSVLIMDTRMEVELVYAFREVAYFHLHLKRYPDSDPEPESQDQPS